MRNPRSSDYRETDDLSENNIEHAIGPKTKIETLCNNIGIKLFLLRNIPRPSPTCFSILAFEFDQLAHYYQEEFATFKKFSSLINALKSISTAIQYSRLPEEDSRFMQMAQRLYCISLEFFNTIYKFPNNFQTIYQEVDILELIQSIQHSLHLVNKDSIVRSIQSDTLIPTNNSPSVTHLIDHFRWLTAAICIRECRTSRDTEEKTAFLRSASSQLVAITTDSLTLGWNHRTLKELIKVTATSLEDIVTRLKKLTSESQTSKRTAQTYTHFLASRTTESVNLRQCDSRNSPTL